MVKIKKCIAIILTFTILVLCGCNKIDSEMLNDIGNPIYTTDDSGIEAELNIPASCNMVIDTGDLSLSTVYISDDDISVPSTEKMSLFYYQVKESDNMYRKNIIDAVFENPSEVYIYDIYNLSKKEILIEKEYYQMCLDLAERKNDISGIEIYQDYLDDCANKYEEAAGDVVLADDYTSNSYIGKINDNWYLLTFNENLNENSQGFQLSAFPEGSLIYRSEHDDVCGAYIGNTFGDSIEQELEDVQNISDMSSEDAQEIAAAFLGKCGITDVSVYETGNLEWDYTNIFFEDIDYLVEYNGYYVIFERSLDGVFPYVFDSSELDNIETNNLYNGTEFFTIYVDEYGIVGLECNIFYEASDIEDEDVKLLSWDEVTEAIATQLPKYYEKYPTSYSTITFNMIELSYYLIPDEIDEDKLVYTPVWIFASIDTDMLEYDYTYLPEQLFILNAVTGEYVNLE